jgi:hypothetical protein
MRLGILAFAVLAAGCATVARGTSEQIQFDTIPASAEVRVIARSPFETSETPQPDAPPPKTLACVTPCVLQVKRNEKLAITITKAGYATESFPLDPQASGEGVGGAIIGNALIGGALGVVVDSASGAMLDHCPNPVRLTLRSVASPPARGRARQPEPETRPSYDPVAMCKEQNAAKYRTSDQNPPANM